MKTNLPETPLVSILTPCYKSAKYLERCIQSVLNQDYARVEMVVQDAASQDGTLEILKSFDGRIRWSSEPDQGQAHGLNKALQKCRGDIIGVLNADDEYLPHAISWAVQNLKIHSKAAVLYGQQHNVDDDGNILTEASRLAPYDYKKILCCESVIPAQAAFVRRSALEAVGFYVDTTLKTCPDYEWWVRLGLKFPFVYLPETTTLYRWHPDSEGQIERVVYRMIEVKQHVMQRICDDPCTPEEVRKLKKRATTGILKWSICHLTPPALNVNYFASCKLLAKAYLISPKRLDILTEFMLTGIDMLVSPIFFRNRKFFSVTGVFRSLNVKNSVGCQVNRLRTMLRKSDERLFGGCVYKALYLPLKRRALAFMFSDKDFLRTHR